MTTLLTRAQRETGATPGYASLFHYGGKLIVILGNTVKTRRDGTHWIWAADWATGERINATVADVTPYDGTQPALLDVVRRVEGWARQGNADAMWWLADFYECGSRATGANGGKALAYYLGAIRCQPEWYEQETVERVLQDGCTLFLAGHPADVADHTPRDKATFLAQFREYREVKSHGHIFYPDNRDWQACITIAEAA